VAIEIIEIEMMVIKREAEEEEEEDMVVAVGANLIKVPRYRRLLKVQHIN
jgi:hypothetical protein